MIKLFIMMRYVTCLLLTASLNVGFAESLSPAHLDSSILKQYQNKTPTQAALAEQQSIEKALKPLYLDLQTQPNTTTLYRLNYFSQHYLNHPYILFPLGEGQPNDYDEMPRVRFDGFDCETYVDTVLALTFAKGVEQFQSCLDHIRYRKGVVSFLTRNHFTSVDWNKNNQHQGYLEDITATLVDQNKHPVARYVTTVIDKAAWYQKLPLSRIRVPTLTTEQQLARLKTLQAAGKHFKPERAHLAYVPLAQLINKQGAPNHYLLKQITSGAIVEIVRPNWQLKNIIGTNLDVSHLGFAFWKNNVLYFRQASSIEHRVIDSPMIEYLIEASKSPTIGGINIQVVKTPHPSCGGIKPAARAN